MAVLGAALPTAEDVQKTKNSVYEIKDTGGVKELWQGFKEENLFTQAWDFFVNSQDFPEDETYNPFQDSKLENVGSLIDNFALSKSSAESDAILKKIQERNDYNSHSPYYHIGRVAGFALDPSTALLATKAGRGSLMLGTALTSEEILKQNFDSLRDDSYVPWTIGLGYGLPVLINGFFTHIPQNVRQKITDSDKAFHAEQKQVKAISQEAYEDGKFINPNQTSVGAAANTEAQSRVLTPKADFEGEQFVKSNLGIFGENGPWTPVFRLTKSIVPTARKMIADILDTPLLKLKNTKEWGFQATEQSLEMQLKMREAPIVQAQMEVKNLYLKYLERNGMQVPKSEIGINLSNRFNDRGLSITQFNQEVSKARLNDFTHSIPEVAEAARITESLVYGPIGKEASELGLFAQTALREKNFWEGIKTAMKKNKETVRTFKSEIDGKSTTWTMTQVENQLAKIEERLTNLKQYGGLKKNYINIIYNKNAIDKNKGLFREIVKEDLIKQNRFVNEAKLDQLVEDLSTHFPFIRYEQVLANESERFAFQRPRFARSTRARSLNLTKEAQIKLLDNNFILGDTMSLMKTYYRQMTPDILLTKKYGDTSGLGYRALEKDSMFEKGLVGVNEDINNLLLQGKITRQEAIKIRKDVVQDLEASIELLRGTYGLPADPTKWFSVGMRTMKNYNALTMLTGFMAALPDVARIVMTSGIKRGFRTQIETFTSGIQNNITKISKAEAQRFGEAIDMITGQRAMLFSDIGDMFGIHNKVEAGLSKLANINFMYVNLMSRWTEFVKGAAALTISTRIIEDCKLWRAGKLGDKWKTKLAASGIDEDMARRIANEADNHATKTQYNYLPNTAKWSDTAAEQAFGGALNKDINITIVTPTKGDTPLWMSTEVGSTIAQFKKFTMGATQRMLLRGMQEKDMDFLFGSILLLGSGLMIDGLYQTHRFNKDYSKISLNEKLLAAFDRSGLGGIYVDINRAIESLTDNRIGIRPMLGARKPYGTDLKNKVSTLLGPSSGQIVNMFNIAYDVGTNKYNHYTARNVRRLIPFQNVWYLDWLFDDIEKGLR
jgi:hypothetical protein